MSDEDAKQSGQVASNMSSEFYQSMEGKILMLHNQVNVMLIEGLTMKID